ncbi:hypothetical protein B0H94_11312 [Salsuginibacillus halophilus]|uniref:Uncharacterized protein n=1 Tax=Salsuginibacillus halophilus TaxID=517424 RepID=A0A2P8H917_9BACI|nr:hypothetical protein B0H94_11312 [Salsuginibacillus halophilus]
MNQNQRVFLFLFGGISLGLFGLTMLSLSAVYILPT